MKKFLFFFIIGGIKCFKMIFIMGTPFFTIIKTDNIIPLPKTLPSHLTPHSTPQNSPILRGKTKTEIEMASSSSWSSFSNNINYITRWNEWINEWMKKKRLKLLILLPGKWPLQKHQIKEERMYNSFLYIQNEKEKRDEKGKMILSVGEFFCTSACNSQFTFLIFISFSSDGPGSLQEK